jgi:hypothetical protein
MKGTLPFIGKLLFPRSILLSFFLLLFGLSVVKAKTVVIGSGFGFVSVQNMNGLNPGDVLAITPGTYTGGSFTNLKGITITNNNGTVIFGDQVTLNTLVECTFSGFQFRNAPGIGIRWDGNSRRCVEKNISFYNVAGSANDASDHNQYNGDTSSLKLYMCTFDSLTLFRSGLVMMASWGGAQDNICFVDSIVFSRIKVDSTISNGTEVRGTFFRLDAHDWKVTYKGENTVLGDVGIFYVVGNGYFHNIYRTGGRGYIVRIWNAGLNKVVSNTYFYNNIDLNSSVYGSIDTRVEQTSISQYTTGGNSYVYNNTSGNKNDNIGFWSPIAVVGVFISPFKCYVRNNLGFNLFTRGKQPIAMDQSNGSWTADSSNNMYFTKPDGVLDPVTGVLTANSPVLGKGLTVPWIKDDYYHNPRAGAYDVGAVQHGGAIIPSTNQPPVAIADKKQTITLPVNNGNLDGTKSYDTDDGISTYAWTLTSGTGGTITSPNASSTTVTGLSQGTYIYKLTVTDNSKATASTLDTIEVKPAANIPPVANAGAAQSITLPNNTVTVDGSASKDQDGTIATYTWSQTSGPSTATIASSATASSSITGLQQGVYVFTLKVTDNKGASTTDDVSITVNAAQNKTPVANAGASKTITLPANTANLDGSLSADPDGSIATYSWAQITGPSNAPLSGTSTATATADNLVVGQYTFELTVTDNKGATAKAQVKITVVPSGIQPPIANAGANQTITLPTNSVTIDGNASSASSGSITGYTWTEGSGPTAAALTNTAQNIVGNMQAGTYVFYLKVTDNNGDNATDSVIITVNPAANKAPVANAGSSVTLTLPDNTATLDGSKSSDPDGSISKYSWTKISGPNDPTVKGENTATLSLNDLVAGAYTYQLTVTDNSGASSSAQVKITVADVPNASPVAKAGADQVLTAPAGTIALDGSGSSDPDGSISKYSWVKISGPGSITITNANAAKASADGLQTGTYVFELTVTDNKGATAKDDVTITVNAKPATPNQSPVAKAGSDRTMTAPANTAELDGSGSYDPDGSISKYSWVKTSGPGAITISNGNSASPAISGLQVGAYVFTLTVTDNDGATATDQVSITVNPKPVTPNQLPIANAGNNLTITAPASSIALNGSSSFDPDGTLTGYSWRQVSGPSTSTITGATSVTPTVSKLSVGQYVYELTVTDNDGATDKDQMTVTVNAPVAKINQAPVADAGSDGIVSLPVNTFVLNASQSSDPDGNIVTYQWQELSGPGTVTSSAMNNSTVSISDLQEGVYEFQVTVTDNQGMSSKASMKITVENGSLAVDQLMIYPNPAHDVVHAKITTPVTGTVKMNVYDMNGRMVLSDQIEKSGDVVEKTFMIDQLASGMYTLQINIANRKNMVAKFIKN